MGLAQEEEEAEAAELGNAIGRTGKMNRRGFLSNTARLGTGSLIASCAPLQTLAVADPSWRLLWYSTHCVDCGMPFPGKAEITDYARSGGRYWCLFCCEYGSGEGRAAYQENPPADFGPGREWRSVPATRRPRSGAWTGG